MEAMEDFSFDSRNIVSISPRGFDYYFSAPASPNFQNAFSFTPLSQPYLNYNYDHGCGEKDDDSKTFAFSIRGDLDLLPLSSADELFDNGKIKPREANRQKIIKHTLSFDRNIKICSEQFTVSKENEKDSSLSASSSVGWLRKKWRLKELLFCSAPKNHESNRSNFSRKFKEENLKNMSETKKKKNGRPLVALSAHERHYKVKRAAAEEMRKRTYLPYKQNLMIGCVDLAAGGVSDSSRVAIRIRS